MKKDLPGIFAGKVNRNDTNKKYAVTSSDEVRIEKNDEKEYKGIPIGKNINQKINDIFSSYRYVYKADVIITTNEGEITKKIIGKNENNLITMDNELINIDNIKDIRFKE